MLAALIKWSFITSALLLQVSCWYADSLPGDIALLEDLAEEPEQFAVEEPAFETEQGGVRYRVDPQYRYRLQGLVVSRRAHDGDRMLHRRWNDHLNVADVCVVWGDAARVDLSAFEFWSGQFTCFFRTDSASAWQAFRPDQLANNHLLADRAYLREQIADVQVGDQIRLEGFLASYSNDSGFERGTSTTRTDTGNGACETVWVTRFDVLQPSPSVWPAVQGLAGFGLLGSMLAWLVAALRDWI